MRGSVHPGLAARIASWAWDYLLILAGLVVVFALIGLPQLLGFWDLSRIWSVAWLADLVVALVTVVPLWLYLTVSEGRSRHATWGKRKSGLEVVDNVGQVPQTWRILMRNLIKVLPWQIAHLGIARLVVASGSEPVALSLVVSSMILLVFIAGPVLTHRTGLHDLVAGTRVVTVSR